MACASMGVNAVGFLINTNELEDEQDKLSLHSTKALIKQVPPTMTSFVLLKDQDIRQLERKLAFLVPDVVQLQNPAVNKEHLQQLKNSFPNIELVKTIRVSEHTIYEEVLKQVEEVMPYADAVLLDSQKGGSGLTHNWSISTAIVKHCSKLHYPVVLAGGLNLENVLNALISINPFMIDLMSSMSVERGVKDVGKIKQLMNIVSGSPYKPLDPSTD